MSSRRPESMRCQARGGFFRPLMARPDVTPDRLRASGNHQMVVDHADSLHEGVDDGRAAEFKAALFEVLATAFPKAASAAGTSSIARKAFTIGRPSTKSQI